MNKLVTYDGNEIQVANEVLLKIQALNQVKKELETYEKEFKEELKNAMEEHGIKSIKNDVFSASFIEEGTRTIFDIDKARELIRQVGQKESDYEKESKVKSTVRIRYK